MRSWPRVPFPSWESGHSHCLVRAGIRSPEQGVPYSPPKPLQAACLHAALLLQGARGAIGQRSGSRPGPAPEERPFVPSCVLSGGEQDWAGGSDLAQPDRSCHYGRAQRGQHGSHSGRMRGTSPCEGACSASGALPACFLVTPAQTTPGEQWVSRKVPYGGRRTRGVPWPLPLTPKCCTQHVCFPGLPRPNLRGRGE